MAGKGSSKSKRKLILTILVILIILLSLLIIGNGTIGTETEYQAMGFGCKQNPNFLCTSPRYVGSTGNIIVMLGENTGINWATANFVFVPQGTIYNSTGIPSISFAFNPANTTYGAIASNGLKSGQTIPISLPVSGSVKVVTTVVNGTIWVAYTTTGGHIQYSQMASIKLPAS